jgi:hypothetical protein
MKTDMVRWGEMATAPMTRRRALRVIGGAVAATAVGGALRPTRGEAAGFGSWAGPLQGAPALTYSPAVCSWAQGRLDVFGIRQDGHVMHADWQGGWSGWDDLGGVASSSPAAASDYPGHVLLVHRGTDQGFWWRQYEGYHGSGWTPWQGLGGIFTSAPAAAFANPGVCHLFGRGTDNALYWQIYAQSQAGDPNAAWGPRTSLGGTLTSAPAVASAGPGLLDVFARGTDNALWHRSYTTNSDGTPGPWSPWQRLGGAFASAPAACSWGSGQVDVFVRDSTNALLWISRPSPQAAWGAWQNLGGQFANDPAAASWGQGRRDVYVVTTNGQLWTYR